MTTPPPTSPVVASDSPESAASHDDFVETHGHDISQEETPGHIPPPRRGWLAGLDRLITGSEAPTALGLCRIALVTVFLASMLSHIGAVGEYFSQESMLSGSFARQAFKHRVSLFFWVEDPMWVRTIFAVGVLAHVLWIVGLFTRVAAVVAFAVWASMVGRNPMLYAMPDQLHTTLMAWLVLMPTGRGLSLDAKWRGKGGPVPVWCRRILQLQLAVVYTTTGLLKTGATWKADGTAIYFALVNPYNRHVDLSHWLAQIQPWVLRPVTWLVLVWEVAFAGMTLALWLREATGKRLFPDLRRIWLGFGAAMHFSIWTMLYVVWFTPTVVAAYAAFLRPDEAGRLARGLAQWLARAQDFASRRFRGRSVGVRAG